LPAGATLSIVVPVYGEEERLWRCLAAAVTALGLAGLPGEILVADDGTPGGLSPEIRARHPEVRWLAPSHRLGFAGNVNRAVAEARGGIVCLLNSDMYVAPDFLHDVARAFADPAVFAVCARILEPGGVDAGWKRLSLSPSGATVRFARDDDPGTRGPARVPYANGGGSLFRRALFLELGGFDPVFAPYYWEDTDLGYRAWKRGYEIRYDPSRILEHDHQGTISREQPRRVRRIKTRNERLFVWRNLTDVSLRRLLLRGTLPALLRDLGRLRLRRVAWAVSDLRLLPAVRRARILSRARDRRTDAEVAALLDTPPEGRAESDPPLARARCVPSRRRAR
jgi:GT2 family glycosyltransferase